MRLLHTFCIAILFALSWQGIKAAEQGRACQSCVTGLSDVHSRLAVMSDSDNALEVQQKACQGLPAQQKELCGTFLQLSLPVMAQKLQDSVQACGDLGLCNATELVIAKAATGANDLNCELCEYVMAMVKEQLEDPQTEKDLLDQAEQVCSSLPGDTKAQCLQYIAQYGKQIFDWVHQENPEEMCIMASFCPPASTFPRLPPRVVKAVTQVLEVQDDDQCNTCQLVVVEASSMLSDPATQKEILDYIKQNCESFQAFADQCATYIDLYGPLVLNMAKQYLKPELCSQLGFCSSQSSRASVSVV